jgi:aspartyl-tRNA(Asn)/glutamyl-tRNA(Gln) amidotransferase subunit C
MEIDVKYVANLARLNLTPKETELFSAQLRDILAYVEKLKEVDIKNVLPTSHVLPIKNVFRDDSVNASLPVSEVLRNAPQKKKDFFKVPKVIE